MTGILKVDQIQNIEDASSVKVNRTTSNGDIIELQKDGTTIVSMGVNGAVGYYQFYPTGSVAIRGGGDDIRPSNNTGANRDNLTDLGDSTVRWRNLYLGGSVYLGGTGSANALDDYEEGTASVDVRVEGRGDSSITGTATSTYTKIGRRVFVDVSKSITGVTGADSGRAFEFFNLPFTTSSTIPTTGYGYISSLSASVTFFMFYTFSNNTIGRIEEWTGTTGTNFSNHFQSGSGVQFSLSYNV